MTVSIADLLIATGIASISGDEANQREILLNEIAEIASFYREAERVGPVNEAAYNIVKYCAEEVDRQQAGPLAVLWMLDGWQYAQHLARKEESTTRFAAFADAIEKLGSLVEPKQNAHGFRRVTVRVGERVCPAPEDVPSLILRLNSNVNVLTPAEYYREFEEIHPFRDGNGRTGKILFNWLNGTLDAPEMPPNFWGIANP